MLDIFVSEAKGKIVGGIMGIAASACTAVSLYIGGVLGIWWENVGGIPIQKILVAIGLLIVASILAWGAVANFKASGRRNSAIDSGKRAKRIVESFPIMIKDFMLSSGAIDEHGKYDATDSYIEKPAYAKTIKRMLKEYLNPEVIEAFIDYSEKQIAPVEQPRSFIDKKLG